VPANIAEGYGRFYYQENVRFCYIARGSLEETFSHLVLAKRLDYLPESKFNEINTEIQELRRMLNGYIAFLKRSKRGANEPGANRSVREAPIPYITELDEES
jgi:four helix bundle protein